MWMFGGSEGVCVGAGGQINWSHVIHAQVSHMLAGGYSTSLPMLVFPTRGTTCAKELT